jgi:hypothetical protein
VNYDKAGPQCYIKPLDPCISLCVGGQGGEWLTSLHVGRLENKEVDGKFSHEPVGVGSWSQMWVDLWNIIMTFLAHLRGFLKLFPFIFS